MESQITIYDRAYWEERNRDRLAKIAASPPRPGYENELIIAPYAIEKKFHSPSPTTGCFRK